MQTGTQAEPRGLSRPWAGMLHSYTIDDARIVATFGSDGGAILDQGITLEGEEGRQLHVHGNGPNEPNDYTLEYSFRFSVAGAPAAEASESAYVRIVITGRHSSGHRIEIRGNGHIGYDDLGNIGGHFDDPPVVTTEESDWATDRGRKK
jgi:hypothetical protein